MLEIGTRLLPPKTVRWLQLQTVVMGIDSLDTEQPDVAHLLLASSKYWQLTKYMAEETLMAVSTSGLTRVIEYSFELSKSLWTELL